MCYGRRCKNEAQAIPFREREPGTVLGYCNLRKCDCGANGWLLVAVRDMVMRDFDERCLQVGLIIVTVLFGGFPWVVLVISTLRHGL